MSKEQTEAILKGDGDSGKPPAAGCLESHGGGSLSPAPCSPTALGKGEANKLLSQRMKKVMADNPKKLANLIDLDPSNKQELS
ncbi:hypothetical protein RND71_018216 [Anisodus tanguticus]|uniref:Uncharacterized protein n=1 Tax=Anisodus tanguticus TaxID=243964 RepID=A0AAE1S3Y3_9SOLA|nr:hypothetical protein RND71_018216 [Anisodus tanguticus]